MIIEYDLVNKLAADLDLKVLRSQLIASNIANVDTPGYKAKDVKFSRILADNMGDGDTPLKRTHVKHMTGMESLSGAPDEIVQDPNPGRPDGNNVNIDEEMLKLTENNISFNTSVQLLTKHLYQLNEAINQSR